MKIRLNDILDFRYNPNRNIKPANVSDNIVS